MTGDRRTVIGATGRGKAAALAAFLDEFEREHPLGTARRWGPGVILLHPGPDVVQGEVISRAREIGASDGDE